LNNSRTANDLNTLILPINRKSLQKYENTGQAKNSKVRVRIPVKKEDPLTSFSRGGTVYSLLRKRLLKRSDAMELCSNCFRNISREYLFCPWCGYPAGNIGLKQCNKGHIIYETFKSCVFCQQAENLGKSFLDPGRQEGVPTEPIPPPGLEETVFENITADKTVLETAPGVTVVEADSLDKTRLETYGDATVLEDDDDKTRLDTEGTQPVEKAPTFFAWLVFTDEDGLPSRDVRLLKEKSIIGKGDEADIRVSDDFTSKLHALIYREKDEFYLSDLGSTNGTFLNDQKVMKEELKDGDRIRIGHQPMTFKRVLRKIS
jgi:hypothetical protein